MKLQLRYRLGTLIPLVLVICISFACGASSEVTERVAEEPVALEVELGPGTFDLPDTRVGLADLSSYKAILRLTFDGTQGGQAWQWSNTFEMIQTRELLVRQLNIHWTGNASEDDPELPEFIAEKDGASYQRLTEGGCTATVINSGISLMDLLEPAGQLRTVFGASTAGHEAVNGIETEKYTFDERAIGRKGLSESIGEMWISSDGGYIVRYVLTTKGDEDFFGEEMEGTMTWDYELSEVNQPISIELPQDCPPNLVSAPMLADATNVLSMPGLLQYETPSTVSDVQAFYQAELLKLGWSAPSPSLPEGMTQEEYDQMLQDLQQLGVAQPTPTPNPSEAFLVFQQGDQLLYLLITQGETSTQVVITLRNKTE